jgi:general secretion pathway protein N
MRDDPLARTLRQRFAVLLCVTVAVLAATSASPQQATERGPFDVTRRAMILPGAAVNPDVNPLWSMPLGALTATRERPLFSSSRRPPAPVVVNAPVASPPPPPPPPSAPERPNLNLIGTVSGRTGGIAVFLDSTTSATVRLHTGDSHMGWTLRSVNRRAAELHKGDQIETLGLTAAGSQQTPGLPGPGVQQGQIPVAMPAPPPPPPPPRPPRPPRRSR